MFLPLVVAILLLLANILHSSDVQVAEPVINGASFDSLEQHLIQSIGEYLDRPHATLGSINVLTRSIFSSITPSQLVANYLRWPALQSMPRSLELNYFYGLSHAFLEENFSFFILDMTLIKLFSLNNRGLILRAIYTKITDGGGGGAMAHSREQLLTIWPLFQSSPLSALFQSFLSLNDYEMVFKMWEDFPELLWPPNAIQDTVIDPEMVKMLVQLKKVGVVGYYFQHGNFDYQYKLVTGIVAYDLDLDPIFHLLQRFQMISDDLSIPVILTLDILIDALSLVTGSYSESDQQKLTTIWQHVNQPLFHRQEEAILFRKHVLGCIVALRLKQPRNARMSFELLSKSVLTTDQFLWAIERVFQVCVIEGERDLFIHLLRMFTSFHHRRYYFRGSILRSMIASDPELVEKMVIEHDQANLNLSALFAANLFSEAIVNKPLLFKLYNLPSQQEYLQTAQLHNELFDYVFLHLKDPSEIVSFIVSRNDWQMTSLAMFIGRMLSLETGRDLPKTETVLSAIKDIISSNLYLWRLKHSHSFIDLGFDGCIFLLRNPTLHFILKLFTFRVDQFVLLKVVALPESSNFKFLLPSIRIASQIPTSPIAHLSSMSAIKRLSEISLQPVIRMLVSAISNLQENVSDDGIGSKLFQVLFVHVIDYLKQEYPLLLLNVLPKPFLLDLLLGDERLVRRVFLSDGVKNPKLLQDLVAKLKGMTIKVTFSSSELSSDIKELLHLARVTLHFP